MSPIIAGQFESLAKAEEAARSLYARGFSVWDVSIMSVSQASRDARDEDWEDHRVMLAARVNNGLAQDVNDILCQSGAAEVCKTQGEWEGGRWTDFDGATRGMQAMANGQKPDTTKKDEPPQGGGNKVNPPVADEATDTESTGNEDPGSELEHYVEEQRTSKN